MSEKNEKRDAPDNGNGQESFKDYNQKAQDTFVFHFMRETKYHLKTTIMRVAKRKRKQGGENLFQDGNRLRVEQLDCSAIERDYIQIGSHEKKKQKMKKVTV